MTTHKDTAGIIERLKWPESCPEIKRRLHDIANGITLRECADSDAHFLHDLADNLPAIQQAVSECSGGGAEKMQQRCYTLQIPSDEMSAYQADGYSDGWSAAIRAYRRAIRALPLPPSPVKRDLPTAQADLAAALRTAGSLPDSTYVHDSDVRISIGTLRALAEATVKESMDAVIEACARWYDEHGWELDPMNVSAHMKRALKSTPHQGGEGK